MSPVSGYHALMKSDIVVHVPELTAKFWMTPCDQPPRSCPPREIPEPYTWPREYTQTSIREYCGYSSEQKLGKYEKRRRKTKDRGIASRRLNEFEDYDRKQNPVRKMDDREHKDGKPYRSGRPTDEVKQATSEHRRQM